MKIVAGKVTIDWKWRYYLKDEYTDNDVPTAITASQEERIFLMFSTLLLATLSPKKTMSGFRFPPHSGQGGTLNDSTFS